MSTLLATHFEEHPYTGYRGRTLRNASADVTFAFAADFSTAGEKLTKRAVLEQGRVYCPVAYRGHLATENAIQAAVDALNRAGKPAVTLNIAGNGVYTLKALGNQAAVDAYTEDFLRRVLASPLLKASITTVSSGGQTGFDEAGVKAARRVGLRTYVLAPKGWRFRTADGHDVSDEQAFKERFDDSCSKNCENERGGPMHAIDAMLYFTSQESCDIGSSVVVDVTTGEFDGDQAFDDMASLTEDDPVGPDGEYLQIGERRFDVTREPGSWRFRVIDLDGLRQVAVEMEPAPAPEVDRESPSPI